MTNETARPFYLRDDLSIEQELALRAAASRLQSEFAVSVGMETIERFLHSSYEQFATRATIENYLPLLAERFARQRLHALARSRAAGATVDRSCCSCALTTPDGRRWRWGSPPTSPGTPPWPGRAARSQAREVNRAAIAAMAERGIETPGEYRKPWTDEIVQAADVVVAMAAVTPARSSPAAVTRNGSSTIPQVSPSTRCVPSVTRSNAGYGSCWSSSTSRLMRNPLRRLTSTIAWLRAAIPTRRPARPLAARRLQWASGLVDKQIHGVVESLGRSPCNRTEIESAIIDR